MVSAHTQNPSNIQLPQASDLYPPKTETREPLDTIGYHRVSSGTIGCHRVSSGIIGYHRVLWEELR